MKSLQFYSDNSIWYSFTPCVDSVMAAAAADFPGLAKWLPATGRGRSSSDIIHTCRLTYNVTMASPVMGHHQVQAHVRNFLLLEGAAETAPDAEGIL